MCRSNSTRASIQRKDRGSLFLRLSEHHRTDGPASRATWEQSYLHCDFSAAKSHYTTPIVFESCLSRTICTQRAEVFVVFVAILVHADIVSSRREASNRVSVHDRLMSSLVGLDKPIKFDRSPELRGENLTEESPRP